MSKDDVVINHKTLNENKIHTKIICVLVVYYLKSV